MPRTPSSFHGLAHVPRRQRPENRISILLFNNTRPLSNGITAFHNIMVGLSTYHSDADDSTRRGRIRRKQQPIKPLDETRKYCSFSIFINGFKTGLFHWFVLLYTDLPSLTRFRRVNRRAMDLVDSVPQYAAIIKHCPNIIRAILSIQADSFNCHVLYTTLSTTRCFTCERFGDPLYLIDCRRVCYFCFTRRLEYFPLTIGRASSFFAPNGTQRRNAITSRQHLRAANPPSVLSLPGRYCTAWASGGGNLVRKRLQLFDRGAVIQDLAGSGLPKVDKTTREPLRFMAIITAPHLFDSGPRADWGYFCLGCKEEKEEKTKHFRIKYTREEVSEHIAKYGPVKETPRIPGRFMHVTQV
ncbi:uncharacterized protein NECHADRAFT_78111 [Fusarium vanettenii 77-13-4]|uniref:F-box domain-containing protein n=1 Tax=Fusarium vanettenii (strain ATCC MYA-4622 / CBS 123669 / FGSC 9596 / NRRL 45880 / 77-13-4) TaxID=660122 RepID=C7YN54_FUSV7|nr:uncharacterized protein NECHADRAFT_78111 [Fusarium vanettenii 77-13-4]EEU47065.1 predicted protein [Fusarium vanettenii 77-13-4]